MLGKAYEDFQAQQKINLFLQTIDQGYEFFKIWQFLITKKVCLVVI